MRTKRREEIEYEKYSNDEGLDADASKWQSPTLSLVSQVYNKTAAQDFQNKQYWRVSICGWVALDRMLTGLG